LHEFSSWRHRRNFLASTLNACNRDVAERTGVFLLSEFDKSQVHQVRVKTTPQEPRMNAQVSTHVEDMVNAWARFQAQWWDSLVGIGKGNGQAWEQLYARPLQAGEDMVNCVLQQQSDCIRMVMTNIRPGNGAPRITCEWCDQIESAAQRCVDAQRQAWTTWFVAMRQVDPFRMQGQPRKDAVGQGSSVFDAWKQATHKTLQAQADLMSSLATTGADMAQSSPRATSGNGAQETTSRNKEAAASTAAGS
jgi:hypothetical protein